MLDDSKKFDEDYTRALWDQYHGAMAMLIDYQWWRSVPHEYTWRKSEYSSGIWVTRFRAVHKALDLYKHCINENKYTMASIYSYIMFSHKVKMAYDHPYWKERSIGVQRRGRIMRRFSDE